jgi:dolichol kinase
MAKRTISAISSISINHQPYLSINHIFFHFLHTLLALMAKRTISAPIFFYFFHTLLALTAKRTISAPIFFHFLHTLLALTAKRTISAPIFFHMDPTEMSRLQALTAGCAIPCIASKTARLMGTGLTGLAALQSLERCHREEDSLKGQSHEIFYLWFFPSNCSSWAQ